MNKLANVTLAYPSRVLGCLLGGAIGDAFGYEVEFDRLPAIRKRFGPLGLVEPARHRGKLIVSDDTQMTLFTLEGLNRARSAGCLDDLDATLEHIRLATLDWHLTQVSSPGKAAYTGTLGRSRVMQVRRAPGNTCLSACARLRPLPSGCCGRGRVPHAPLLRSRRLRHPALRCSLRAEQALTTG